MSGNTVQVTLLGVDKLSSVIQGAIVNANILGAAFQGAMSLVSKASDIMVDGIQKAGNTQLDLIGLGGAMVNILNKPFEESLNFAKELNKEFVALGAKLPGTAEQFAMVGRSVADDIFNSFRDADGKIQLPQARQTLLDLTESWTLLAQQAQVDAATAGQLLTRLISGDTLVLKQVLFDKSPAFKAALNQLLAADQKTLKDWDELTTKQRTEFVQKATRMVIPPEAVKSMSQTVSGTLASWQSLIFDPSSGILGFLRELPTRFNANALDALYSLLKGFERMVAQLVRLFPFRVDVMTVIYDSFMWLGSQFDYIADWLSSVDSLASLNSGNRLDRMVQDTTSSIMDFIASNVQNLARGVNVLTRDPKALSRLINGTLDTLTSLMVKGVTNMVNFASTVDWSAVGAIIGYTIVKAIPTLIKSVGRLAVALNVGIFQILQQQVKIIPGVLLGGLSAVWDILNRAIFSVVASASQNLIGGLTTKIRETYSNLTNWLSNIFGQLSGFINYLANDTPLSVVWDAIKSYANLGVRLAKSVISLGVSIASVIGGIIGAVAQSVLAVGKVLISLGVIIVSPILASIHAISEIIRYSVINPLVSKIYPVLVSIGKNLVDTLLKAFYDLRDAVVSAYITVLDSLIALGSIFRVIGSKLYQGLGLFSKGVQFFIDVLIRGIDWLTRGFNQFSQGIQRFSNFLANLNPQILGDAIQDGFNRLVDKIRNMFSGLNLPNPVAGLQNIIKNPVTTLSSGVGGVVSGITNTVGNLVSGITGGIGSVVGSTVSNPDTNSEIAALSRQHEWGNSYSGNLKPLLSAIALEKSKSPPNSKMLIANSSEAILNKKQIGMISNQNGSKVGAPTVNVTINSNQNPEMIADVVINRIGAYIAAI